MNPTNKSGIICSCQYTTKRMTVYHWDVAYPASEQTNIHEDLKLMLTPEVLAFLPPSMQVEDTTAPDWIEARQAESDLLAVQDRQTNTLLGLLILTEFYEPHVAEIRLGYLFSKQHWGKGYATELLQGLVDWCNQTNQPMKLLGGAEKGNKPSAKVLEKAGFMLKQDLSTSSTDIYLKEIASS